MTDRLYYDDPYLYAFDAHVVSVQPRGRQFVVVLDRSAFYPTGGGQQHDNGFIGSGTTRAQVLDVIEQDGDVLHVLDQPLQGDVHGEIDKARRLDLTQQHTGQHILSQAFLHSFNAETISVHMTENNCTLDLPRHLTSEQHAQAEQLANEIVQGNRAVHAAFVGDDDLARMPLRKRPATKHEKIRIVEIDKFDWSPCGGTHVRASGEVGIIKVLRAERRGSEQRIEFTCGMRALRDYRQKNDTVLSLAAQLSVKDSDLAPTLQKLIEDAKEQRRQLNAARTLLLDQEAEQMWRTANEQNGRRVIVHVFEGRTLDEMRQLASRLREKPATIILFALAGEKPNLVFARAADLSPNMGVLLREVCEQFGGRGGGQPELAQGGVASGSALTHVLAVATQTLSLE